MKYTGVINILNVQVGLMITETPILLVAHLKDLKASNVKHTNEEGTSVLKVLSETTYNIWSLNNLS